LTALKAASGTDAMPLSPALSPERMVWIFRPITDRVEEIGGREDEPQA
jgi:hypothetical protein